MKPLALMLAVTTLLGDEQMRKTLGPAPDLIWLVRAKQGFTL
jgi:hypothetical protein